MIPVLVAVAAHAVPLKPPVPVAQKKSVTPGFAYGLVSWRRVVPPSRLSTAVGLAAAAAAEVPMGTVHGFELAPAQ